MVPEKTLHDYQLIARDWLRARDKSALFLDMGMGKTASTLAALEERHLPVLVIAPKRVAETVWGPEVKDWRPDLSFAVAMGTPAQRRKILEGGADIITLGRDNIKDLLDVSTPFQTIVLDELSGFKSFASQRFKLLRKLIKAWKIPHVWGLTGTPAPNGLMDLWSQVYLLDEGERLGRNITAFRNRYFYPGNRLPNGIVTEWKLREFAEENIHAKLIDLAMYMESTRESETIVNPVMIQLTPEARRVYRDLKKDLVVKLDLMYGLKHVAANAAVLTSKLSQITAGFIYDNDDMGNPLTTYTELHTESVKAVQEIIDGTGSPILVFYRFRAELEMLQRAIPQARHISEKGIVDEWNSGSVPVLLAHPASAGHGLNLQYGGHTLVWTSLPWSLEEWQQGNKRLDRQGQTHQVMIHVVTAAGTIDAVIAERLVEKNDVQEALLNHLESPL